MNGNLIGFVKIDSNKEARAIKDKIGNKKFLGTKLDLKLAIKKSKDKASILKEEEIVKRKKAGRSKPWSGYSKVSRQSDFSSKEKHKVGTVELNSNYPTCFNNSYICFSLFPMKGQILHEVFQEMKISGLKVKEISCWKFLLSFSSKKAKMLSMFSQLKSGFTISENLTMKTSSSIERLLWKLEDYLYMHGRKRS